MPKSKSNKKSESSSPNNLVVTQCFNCGQEVELPTVRLEAMNETGQDVYCRNCDEDYDEDDEEIGFVPFF